MARLSTFGRLAALAGACLVAAACDSPSDLDADGDTLMRTDALVYTLAEKGVLLEADIPFTYENRTGGAVYLVNCNGFVPPDLERKVDGEWRLEWGSAQDACLSQPLIIAAGETYADTLRVRAPLYGSNAGPQFPSPDASGTYRLRWDHALSSYDPRANPFGEEIPLALRVSNAFELEQR